MIVLLYAIIGGGIAQALVMLLYYLTECKPRRRK